MAIDVIHICIMTSCNDIDTNIHNKNFIAPRTSFHKINKNPLYSFRRSIKNREDCMPLTMGVLIIVMKHFQ